MPTVVEASGIQDIDGILWGWRWSGTSLTYSFPTSSAEYINNGYAAVNGFEAFNSSQQAAMVKILNNFSNVCGLNITLAPAGTIASLRFAEASSLNYGGINFGLHVPGFANNSAEGNPPDPTDFNNYQHGDCWFNHTSYNTPTSGSFAFAAGLMHEVGHAVGLKHGHSTQFVDHQGHTHTFPTLPAGHNSQEYSIMTYNTFPGGSGATNEYPQTLMQDDIAALQYIYGADFNYNNGNTTYAWSSTTGEMFINGIAQGLATSDNHILLTVWDGGGVDTYDFSNFATALVVDLNPGNWSTTSAAQLADLGAGHVARGNIANALLYQGNVASLIENAIGGSGSDTIIGNAISNTLTGNGGNDYLIGGLGADALVGGSGTDYAIYTSACTVDLLNPGLNTGEAIGDAFSGIEGIIGSGFGDIIYGNDLGNEIYGNDGADLLFGRGGIDILNGGGFDDNLVGGFGGDHLFGGTGTDFALYATEVWLDFTTPGSNTGEAAGDLFSSIEGVYASGYNDVVLGDGNSNSLWGNDGNDWLFGRGGIDTLVGGNGGDHLYGGTGNDLLIGNGGTDFFVFEDGWGSDTVWDFANGTEQLDLRAVTGLTSIGQLTIASAAGGTLVSFGGNSILLNGIAVASVESSDFLLN